MSYSALTLYVTERCNYSCVYCYQERGRRTLPLSDLVRALDVFLPRLSAEGEIDFYGGEPLLAFGLIRRAVQAAERKLGRGRKVRFGLTTNGSLLDDDAVAFLGDHRFRILVSFDGLAQDVSRRRGSGRVLVNRLERLLRNPALSVETNSVFTPKTVSLLAGSLKLIHELGVPEIHLSLSNLEPWPEAALASLEKQLNEYGRFARNRRRKTGECPLDVLRSSGRTGYFACGAGANRIAVAPDGTVWGCHLFIDHFRGRRRSAEARGYSFGRPGRFLEASPAVCHEIMTRYSRLNMFGFRTPERACLACPDVGECAVCPLEAAPPGGTIGCIPTWTCRIAKILSAARDGFQSVRASSGP